MKGLRAAALVALALLAVACPRDEPTVGSPSASVIATTTTPSASASGGTFSPSGLSAAQAMKTLCIPAQPGDHPQGQNDTSPAVAQVEQEVEAARGLDYLHPVVVEPVTQAELDRRLTQDFDLNYPQVFLDRRSNAWDAMGLISDGASLRDSLRNFLQGGVGAFYDQHTKELVYPDDGSSTLGLVELQTVAHELTHALDDQHFDLVQLMDPLGNACRDEPATAVLALIEGSAQYFSLKVLIDSGSITFEDLDTLIQEVLGSSFSPVDAEPFLLQQLYFPYQDGLEFVQALEARGGTAAVNAAFQHPPVTTEQVIHPEKYPSDRPERLDIPDLAPGLGQDWGDLDVMQVGEDFLREALRLVEPADQADAAAAGWDGGIYRAWTNGSSVAVVLRTAWDTSADAQEFADATGPWLDGLDARVTVDGTRVDVIFGTDEQTFASLRSAVGQR